MPKIPTKPGGNHRGSLTFSEDKVRIAREEYEAARAVDDGEGELVPIPCDELARMYPKLRPVIISHLLREGESLNIIGLPKSHKSWFALNLALCVANGRDFLGLKCRKSRVLYLDNELHPETIVSRGIRVAKALKVPWEGIDVLPLRGLGVDYLNLGERLPDLHRPGKYGFVVCDSHYRMLPMGTDENNNSQVKDVFNLIDRYADQMRAGFGLVHHSSRGDQSHKVLTDVGSGAGSQSRAVDCHMVLRKHNEGDHSYVMEATLRSFKPFQPVGLQWMVPTWAVDHSLNVKDLETTKKRVDKKEDSVKKGEVLSLIRKRKEGVTVFDVTTGLKVGATRAQRLLNELVENGKVAAADEQRGRKQTQVYSCVR